MIVPMNRFRVAGPQHMARDIIRRLRDFGAVHVIPPSQDPRLRESGLRSGIFSREDSEKLGEAEKLLHGIRLAIEALPGTEPPDEFDMQSVIYFEDWVSAEAFAYFRKITFEILDISGKLETMQARLTEVSLYRRIFTEFLPLIEMVASSGEVELIGVMFPHEIKDQMSKVERRLDKVTGGAYTMFRTSESEIGLAGLVVVPASLHEKTLRMVFERKIRPIHVPEQYSADTFAMTLKNLFEGEKELQSQITKLETQLDNLSGKYRFSLIEAESRISSETALLRTQNFIIHSERTFWLSGWVPEGDSERIMKQLDKEFESAVVVNLARPSVDEYGQTPVKLRNARWARPFERFINLYSLPMYGTFDPSWVMAVTFPLLFGMILGDVGYAALLAAAGYALGRYLPGHGLARDASFIITACAVSAAVFGVVYGEFFGKLWYAAGLPEPLFDRKEETGHLLYLVFMIGMAHVVFGSAIGVLNGLSLGNAAKAVEKAADIVFLVSAVWIAVVIIEGGEVNEGLLIPLSALVVKALAGKPVETATEIPKLLTNVLSYARLMALGLASITLADLADDMMLQATGWVAAWMAAAVCLHALNFVIGVISPAIQAGRLHYVEFFTQFYEPRGTPYTPLGAIE